MKTVLIGAGWVAGEHVKALQTLGVTIAGVMDTNRKQAETLAASCGARVLNSVADIDDSVDMVHLLTPPGQRRDYAQQVMRRHKHVYMEKPIALTAKDARDMIGWAQTENICLMLGFNHRFRKGYQLLHESVHSGRLGQIDNVFFQRIGAGNGFRGRGLDGNWRTDPKQACGMTIESVSHDIDMLLHLVDGVTSISAQVQGANAKFPDFDNNSSISCRLKSGGIGQLHASWSSTLGMSCRGVIGSQGTAMLRGEGQWDFSDFIWQTDDMPYPQTTHVGELGITTNLDSYVEANRHFLDCIKTGTRPLTDGEDGLNALLFSLAVLESSKTQSVVKVDL